MVDDPSESSEAGDDTKQRVERGSRRTGWPRVSVVAGRGDAVFESPSLPLLSPSLPLNFYLSLNTLLVTFNSYPSPLSVPLNKMKMEITTRGVGVIYLVGMFSFLGPGQQNRSALN